MPTRKILGVLLDANKSSLRTVRLNDSLDSFYEAIDCTTIDIVSRNIGGVNVNIVCDDEALLKAPTITSAVNRYGHPALHGNLFVTGKLDSDGNLTSLTKDEVKRVYSNAFNLPHLINRGWKNTPVLGLLD